MKRIKKIGIFTSGGDSPGMNACIRAAVRTAHAKGVDVTGIMEGYEGMITGYFKPLDAHDVSGIISRGGTILKSSRSKEFETVAGRKKAFEKLRAKNVDALIAIGGDGTFKGAEALNAESGIPVVGCPGTIDNDLYGTDRTIGFDTACNTAMEALDRIRDTATSHNRLFLVEVMGRDAGCIALHSCIAGGAEAALLPEKIDDLPKLMHFLEEKADRKIHGNVIVVSEGDETGGAAEVERMINSKYPAYDTKVTVLGHLQRGGSPSCSDRILASKLGSAAVEELLNGADLHMAGEVNGKVKLTPFTEAVNRKKPFDKELMRLSELLVI